MPISGRKGAGISAHGVADLRLDRFDHDLQRGLTAGGMQRQAAGQQPAAAGQHQHDPPGREHRRGDRDGSDVKDDVRA